MTIRNETEGAQRVTDVIRRERPRLQAWLKRHAPSAEDVEDILQEAFSEFFVAYRLTIPIQHAGAWLMRVARNRLTDLFRKHRALSLESMHLPAAGEGHESAHVDEYRLLDEFLHDRGPSPETAHAWNALALQLETSLEALPEAQRKVFMAHEILGQSFNEISSTTGDSISTLLARKHSAVLILRKRLRPTYDDTVGI